MQQWTIVPVGGAAALTNGVYTFVNSGLRAAACGVTYLGANGCPSNAVGFAAADTGNGLQRWRLTYVAGSNGVFDVRPVGL